MGLFDFLDLLWEAIEDEEDGAAEATLAAADEQLGLFGEVAR